MAQQLWEGGRGMDGGRLWDCGSPLYDSFELASLCQALDRHLMVLPITYAETPGLMGQPHSTGPASPAPQVAMAETTPAAPSGKKSRRLWNIRRRGTPTTREDKGEEVMKGRLQRLLAGLPFCKKQSDKFLPLTS